MMLRLLGCAREESSRLDLDLWAQLRLLVQIWPGLVQIWPRSGGARVLHRKVGPVGEEDARWWRGGGTRPGLEVQGLELICCRPGYAQEGLWW